MSWGRCPRCGGYSNNPSKCLCRPFHCWIDEQDVGDDDPRIVWAHSAEEASETIAAQDYEGDFDEYDVWVMSPSEDAAAVRYDVCVEIYPHFNATRAFDECECHTGDGQTKE